jgi:hypothetical protein
MSGLAKAPEDWILEAEARGGTTVRMELGNHTARSINKVFKQFTSGDDNLVSKSQAKRLIARFEKFRTVVCQATSKTEPALCIINCYLQLVSRQDCSFPLSPTPFRLIAATPAAALLGLYAIL